MELNIKEGIKGYVEQIVTEKDSASKYGSGMVDVFATPAMIALIESTAMKSVLPHLPEGFNTVGTEINVKHLKATPLGMKVWCETLLTKVEGKKLFFDVNAFDEKGQIGSGTHTRYIVETASFMQRLNG
ncbi:MAG: thioesterase family protein [Bacteroidales bacterium]|nr:thioesterase family protein [Bacteroidales bacterium]